MTLTESDLTKIRHLVAERSRLGAQLDRLVLRLREKGATWTEIGYALGITAQGAQKRYGTSRERDDAHREATAASGLKKRQKAARKAREAASGSSAPTRPDSADPWPDGTVQGTIS